MDTAITASASPAPAAMQESSSSQKAAASASPPAHTNTTASSSPAPVRYRPSLLVVLNTCLVLVGATGALLLRVYFVHGGKRMFLSSFLQVCGWPLLLPPICVSLFRDRRSSRHSLANHHLLLPPRLAVSGAVLGAFYAIPTFLYALGSQALPLSTSSLLVATQLAFTAIAAFFLVGLRFTPFSANAVVLLTVGPAVLGVGPGAGKPAGEPSGTYWLGFGETIASTALTGLVYPLVELAMARYGGRTQTAAAAAGHSYATVMQMQAVMGAAGTVVCMVGMAVKGDFGAVPGEAAAFGLGETNYYLVLVWSAVSWLLLNLGILGLIACASSLLAGIVIAVLLPLSEVLAVVFLHEKYDGPKGIALLLSLWGFASYLYGEKLQAAAQRKTTTSMEVEVVEAQNNVVEHITTAGGDLESAANNAIYSI